MMELYDSIIRTADAQLNALGSPARYTYNEKECWPENPEVELILQRDQAFELGGNGRPSANFTCVTTQEELAPSDEVLVYGPDLKDIKQDVSFARIAILHTGELGNDDKAHDAIRSMEYVRYHVFPKGYMTRTSAKNDEERVRVGKQAVKSGISFKTVGFDYIRKYKENPDVKHVKVIFVSDMDVVRELRKAALKVNEITQALSHILDGLPTDCGHCAMKPVCDEVEGMKEMHMGSKKSK